MTVGCGNPSGVAEKSGSAIKAADGPAAVAATTGRATASAAQGIEAAAPLGRTPSQPASPAAPAELADTRQLAKVLDLSKLPAPEGAKIAQPLATQLHVSVPLPVPAAAEFYLGTLEALGWQRGDPASSSITESFAQAALGKDGYRVLVTATQGGPKEANVTIVQLGNLDTRTLPRIDGAQDQYSSASSSLYFTAAPVTEATAALRRLLTAAGWQEYDRAFTQKADRPDAADLLFRQKAYSLAVTISRPPAQPDKTAVQYLASTLSHDLPAPADAQHIEIQDARWILMCDIPRDLAAAAEYYGKAMLEIGFSARPHDVPTGKSMTISFESGAHDVVLVTLAATDGPATKVKLEGYSAAFLETMKQAEADAKIKREAQEKAAAEAKAERAKSFDAASKQQDDLINRAIGKALSEPTKP
jgi:hypothetical protein